MLTQLVHHIITRVWRIYSNIRIFEYFWYEYLFGRSFVSFFVYEYIRIFVRIEINTNITLWPNPIVINWLPLDEEETRTPWADHQKGGYRNNSQLDTNSQLNTATIVNSVAETRMCGSKWPPLLLFSCSWPRFMMTQMCLMLVCSNRSCAFMLGQTFSMVRHSTNRPCDAIPTPSDWMV